MPLGGCRGDSKDFRGLGDAKSHEEAELYQVGLHRVLGRKIVEGLVDAQYILRGGFHGDIDGVEVSVFLITAAFEPFSSTGLVDEDPTHGFRCGGKKVAAAFPSVVFGSQTNPGFVDQRGGLQGVAGLLAGHLLGCKPAKIVVDEGQEFFSSMSVA